MNTTERRKTYTTEQLAAEQAYSAAYRAKNKERLAEERKVRRAAGKENGTTYYRNLFTPEQKASELAYKRRFYQENREKELEYARQYRELNGDRLKAEWQGAYQRRKKYFDDYNRKNAAHIARRRALWTEANKERVKSLNAAWTKANPHRARANAHTRRSRTQGRLSLDIVERLMVLQRGRCACCSHRLGKSYEIDHIVPLALGGSNTDDNVQLLYKKCNRQKGAKHPVKFMQDNRGMLL